MYLVFCRRCHKATLHRIFDCYSIAYANASHLGLTTACNHSGWLIAATTPQSAARRSTSAVRRSTAALLLRADSNALSRAATVSRMSSLEACIRAHVFLLWTRLCSIWAFALRRSASASRLVCLPSTSAPYLALCQHHQLQQSIGSLSKMVHRRVDNRSKCYIDACVLG